MSKTKFKCVHVGRRSPTPPSTDRSSSVETEEFVEDSGRDALLIQSVKSDLGEASVLTRRARLVVQRLFSRVQFVYHTGMLILRHYHVYSYGCIGIMDASSATDIYRGVHIGDELAALQRRYTQFREMVDAILNSFYSRRVDIPTASMLSDDEFMYRGVVDDTRHFAQWDQPKVFQSFPLRWNPGMKKLYMAMFACRPVERSVCDLSSWTCFSEAEVEVCLDCLLREGCVERGGSPSTWRCV